MSPNNMQVSYNPTIMPTPPKAKKPTLTEQAFEQLRSLILTNQLQVGLYYLEQELADRLGLSRTPLREALIRLEQEGLVKVVSRRGVYIRPVSASEMRDIYEVLSCLETGAIEAACSRPVPAEKMHELEATHESMKQALIDDNLDAWAKNDNRFHQILVELSNNEELINLVNSYCDKTHRVRTMTLRIRKPPAQSTEDHRQVIEALKEGDAAKATALNREHRARASEELTSLLTALGNNGVM